METHVNRSVWCKVDNAYLIDFMVRTPIFEWHPVCCGSKNGLCTQIMMIILDSIVNGGGGLYDYLVSTGIFNLIMHEIFT